MPEEAKKELTEEDKRKLKWGLCEDCGDEGSRRTAWCCNVRVCPSCMGSHNRSKSCQMSI